MNQNKNRKIRIVEIVIILLIVGVCAGIFAWQKLYQKPALYAEIYQNDLGRFSECWKVNVIVKGNQCTAKDRP